MSTPKNRESTYLVLDWMLAHGLDQDLLRKRSDSMNLVEKFAKDKLGEDEDKHKRLYNYVRKKTFMDDTSTDGTNFGTIVQDNNSEWQTKITGYINQADSLPALNGVQSMIEGEGKSYEKDSLDKMSAAVDVKIKTFKATGGESVPELQRDIRRASTLDDIDAIYDDTLDKMPPGPDRDRLVDQYNEKRYQIQVRTKAFEIAEEQIVRLL